MRKILIIFICVLLLCGCEKDTSKKEVNVLNWSSYIPFEVISDFEKETGIKVNYGTYSSNEELLAKISSSKEGTYDLIFPSDYMVEVLKERDLVDKLAINLLQELYPDRKIEPIYAREILLGGGNIHCISQQLPQSGQDE